MAIDRNGTEVHAGDLVRFAELDDLETTVIAAAEAGIWVRDARLGDEERLIRSSDRCFELVEHQPTGPASTV